MVLLLILIARENDVVSLGEPHYEYAVDEAKSYKILSQHSTIINEIEIFPQNETKTLTNL